MPPGNISLLTPDGPHGTLERRPNGPRDVFESGESPLVRGYRWIDDPERGMFMSTWDATPSTPYVLKPLSFPNHELMLVIDGSVTIVEPGNRETTFRAGDCFIFPQGCVLQWKLNEYFRKYAVGFKNPDWQQPADRAATRCIPLSPGCELAAITELPAEAFIGTIPVQHARQVFADPTGQFTVRIWDTTACQRKPSAAESHEWTHVLDGSITLSDAAGVAHHFEKGDTFVVSLGTLYGWECPGYFRAIHSTLQPKAAATRAAAAE
jgi:uncharacterized cupin superfamily protein